ncbi:uncharacterized protein VDAG_05427 [Verticillium dahliae VdLs.17]|uniref:Uncharacterized protein n=1 Tax=Verticillium dahliae (strain VdLs.17 / ATCC MYA-4575 / FGSC 10137) TaxID=498257 RepID=G2X5C2_VERDV|nr:uncharacterized protein VDAG_05427 [Verticillium dahliae VdLs.17]EGY14263.1 hypothetical protein VDAG_05427 [Verticillium dahliae VdLs.17]
MIAAVTLRIALVEVTQKRNFCPGQLRTRSRREPNGRTSDSSLEKIKGYGKDSLGISRLHNLFEVHDSAVHQSGRAATFPFLKTPDTKITNSSENAGRAPEFFYAVAGLERQ